MVEGGGGGRGRGGRRRGGGGRGVVLEITKEEAIVGDVDGPSVLQREDTSDSTTRREGRSEDGRHTPLHLSRHKIIKSYVDLV